MLACSPPRARSISLSPDSIQDWNRDLSLVPVNGETNRSAVNARSKSTGARRFLFPYGFRKLSHDRHVRGLYIDIQRSLRTIIIPKGFAHVVLCGYLQQKVFFTTHCACHKVISPHWCSGAGYYLEKRRDIAGAVNSFSIMLIQRVEGVALASIQLHGARGLIIERGQPPLMDTHMFIVLWIYILYRHVITQLQSHDTHVVIITSHVMVTWSVMWSPQGLTWHSQEAGRQSCWDVGYSEAGMDCGQRSSPSWSRWLPGNGRPHPLPSRVSSRVWPAQSRGYGQETDLPHELLWVCTHTHSKELEKSAGHTMSVSVGIGQWKTQ